MVVLAFKEAKERKTLDAQLIAMANIYHAIEYLDFESKKRVLSFILIWIEEHEL